MGAQLLTPALTALFDLEQEIRDVHPEIRFYPFQPVARPVEAALWNWIVPEGSESHWIGTGPTHRDSLVVRATIAVPTSADEQASMWKLLEYADSFLDLVDPALNPQMHPLPLGDCVRRATRTGMSTGLHSFGPQGPPLLGMDFPVELELDRNTFA